ncbi:hypothetical protein BCR32DRAFT_290112 [Anaeromyces robustus]|uniref:Uncharacterized protein n=1 Tax=Anaeromyces robustus TaxID=1754192 RepID=A0A1Y1XKN2_9FUNG|nr:hypothetical protein BCR32DRAFT_290112 [Anaeromyces robustus]|eukprot:ORX86253.1 hypothetical protein BCR32DRAFT_290112 [Anaeromyces robustus]
MDPLSDKIKKSITFVSIDIGSYSTKSISSNFILNKTFENQIDSATRFQLYDIPNNNVYIKDYNNLNNNNSNNNKKNDTSSSKSNLNKKDEIIKYDYLNIRPKCLIDKIKLYNVNYSNSSEYYEDMEDDTDCSSGVCIDNTTGFIGYKIKPPNQKNSYFIAYYYLLQRYVDLYMNELIEKMNPQNQNKKLILIITIPLFEDDPKKVTKDESFKYAKNINKKNYIDNINKGLSKYKDSIIGVVYLTEIESLIYHWKSNYEKQLINSIKKITSNKPIPNIQIPEYKKKVLFIDFGCYQSKYYLVNVCSNQKTLNISKRDNKKKSEKNDGKSNNNNIDNINNNNKNNINNKNCNKNNNNEDNNDDYEIIEWDIVDIAGEKINEGIIQLLLLKYPDIKKGYSKALGKYKIWRTVDQEIKRAFTNPNVKDFSCEILNSGDYYDLMINRNEINSILNPFCQILSSTLKDIVSRNNINDGELEICISGDGALIFNDYITSTMLKSDSTIINKVNTITWNKVNALNGSLLKLQENVNKMVLINRRRRISTLSEKRSISKILYNQNSFDSIISMENNFKNIFHPSQKLEFNFNPNQNQIEKTKTKSSSDSSISEYNTEDIIDFKNVDDVVHYLNVTK